jgi:RNA polymerase sigma-70 factor (ECF subfamily)
MGNHGDADDVTQDVFLRAYRALSKFDGRADLFTWLYRITVNTSLNHIRSRKRTQSIAREGARQSSGTGSRPEKLGEVQRTPLEETQITERMHSVLTELCELSETLRVTLVLATVEVLPYRKIAEILEIPEGTVAWRVNEARKQLRDRVAGKNSSGDSDE